MASRQNAGTGPGRRTAGTPTSLRSADRRLPPRDPGLYALTDHFCDRLGQPGRYASTSTVSEAIRRGQLRWNTTDGWRFALVEEGVRTIVVVGDAETASPVVVTAWTEIADWDDAMASPRWTDSDVETIAVRTALSEADGRGTREQIRPRSVSTPFEVGHHRVTTALDSPHLVCADCERQFHSKDQLTSVYCR